MLNNQKGLTLLEVLAALAIGSMVIGVMSMLFFSVNQMWNTTAQEYNDTAKVNFAVDTITKELAEATDITYITTGTPTDETIEIRYVHFESRIQKKLIYDVSAQTLTLDTGDGSNGYLLLAEVTSFQVSDRAGNPIDATPEGSNDSIPILNLFQIDISYNSKRITVDGSVESISKDIPSIIITPFN